MMRLMALVLLIVSSAALGEIPATPVMTVYQFNGPEAIPYYAADAMARDGAAKPAGTLAQGTSVIPCLVIRNGEPLTDARGTPYVGFDVVVDAAKATPASTARFRAAVAARDDLKVRNHHCDAKTRWVMDIRKLHALTKAPFFISAPTSADRPASRDGQSRLDGIVRAFHASPQCERANRRLTGRRSALAQAWDAFSAARHNDWSPTELARAKHLDYALRTALFEGHLGRGCTAYGACERNVVVLSIRNRARGSCLSHQACRFPGDFQGVASAPSQYNIWDEYLTQISGLTTCFLGDGSPSADDPHADLLRRLRAMYGQSVGDAELILYGGDEDLRRIFPGVPLAQMTSLRHYYHPPAMGKCFPDQERVEYMSGAVARNGEDFALIASTRIQVGRKVGDGYPFQEFFFAQQDDRDRVWVEDNYPGFVVDGRKVELRAPRCAPYGTPSGCRFAAIGRYRKTPSWLAEGTPLALNCRINARDAQCRGSGRIEEVQVGGVCDIEMQPVAGVR